MSQYPNPSYAASIWTEGDTIHMTLPAAYGQDKGHTVVMPNTIKGLCVIAQILREREVAERSFRRIGNNAAPVQYDIDKMLLKMKATDVSVTVIPSVRKTKATDDLSLADLGL